MFNNYILNKEKELKELRDLYTNYFKAVNSQNSLLEAKINILIKNIEQAKDLQSNYDLLYHFTDLRLQRWYANQRINFELDPLFSATTSKNVRSKIYNRELKESTYWYLVFEYKKNLCSRCHLPITFEEDDGGCICSKEHPVCPNKSRTLLYDNGYYADSNYILTKIDLED